MSGGQIRVTGSLRCRPEEVATVVAALPEHIKLSRAEAGCLSFDVMQSPADACRFDLDETFADHDAFSAHQDRTRASDWWTATSHMSRDFSVTDG